MNLRRNCREIKIKFRCFRGMQVKFRRNLGETLEKIKEHRMNSDEIKFKTQLGQNIDKIQKEYREQDINLDKFRYYLDKIHKKLE